MRAAGQALQRREAESTPASRSPVEPGQGGWLPDSRADESAPEIIRLGPSGTAENRRVRSNRWAGPQEGFRDSQRVAGE